MRSVDFGDGKGSITYANDDELAAAISALEGEVTTEAGTTRARVIRIYTSKGMC